MNMRFHSPKLLLASILTLSLSATTNAQEGAPKDVADGVKRLAGAISEFFDREKHDKVVTVGSVVNPDGDGSELLRRLLTENLEKEKFQIRKAKFAVNGRFIKQFRKANTLDEHNSVALRVTAEIRDRTSDEIVQPIAIPIFGDGAAQVLGPSVELPTNASEAKRQKELNESLDAPEATIAGNETLAAPSSAFGMELHIRSGASSIATPRKPVDNEGQAFVKLNRGEEYVVRLHNRARFETAVTLTIDGLSMFAFSKEGNFGSQVLIPPGKYVDIPGWYITKDATDAFEITSYSKSAAASKGLSGSVGVITASFAAAWDPAGQPPSDEVGAKGPDSATGKGRRIDQKYESVNRVVGRNRAIVSVRYSR